MGAYYILVIAVSVWGIISGYRKGIIRLMGSVLAVAFGIVAVHVFAADFTETVSRWLPSGISGFQRSFLGQTLTCGIIYIVVWGVVTLLMLPLRLVLKLFGTGVIGSITGAVFRTFQYLLLLSLVYNVIVDIDPTGNLARTARFHDGNIVEAVLKIAPAVLDFPGAEEVGHRQQLEDAKKIS